MYAVLADEDVDRHLSMDVAIGKMRDALLESAQGTLLAPPRFRLETPAGSLVFTAGAATGAEHAIGFRVYDTFGSGTARPQLVAVFDAVDGELRGVVIGHRIGVLRTAALGGVALDCLARADASTLGVIGAGPQAREQVRAAACIRDLREVRVHGRTASRAEALCADLERELGVPMLPVASAREAVEPADLVICATNSAEPVLDADWVAAGAHVTTIGPKLRGAHELPVELADRAACIVCDSPAQARAYAFFLGDDVALVGLDQLVSGSASGRNSAHEITLFCSVGLAGTEVVLAAELLRRNAA